MMIRKAPSDGRYGRSRYPGTRPFNDTADDYELFFGRNEEGEQLYLRVLSVPLVLQFGKSGCGKTSLLQASLFPRLRQKSFLPVMARLNIAGDTPTVAVARSIQQACKAEGLEFNEVQTDGLWELLSTTTVWRDDLLLTVVLVFDQFEEVFTLQDATFRADLAAELGALASGIVPPERLHAGRSGVPEQLTARPNIKTVISLREDYLGALEEFSASIPNLFHERLRLEPFTERAAREAITGPAQLTSRAGEEPYWAPCFDFESLALDSMIRYLRGRSGIIEPFQLQLLCRHVEAIAYGKGGTKDDPVKLTLADFNGSKGFDAVLKNFYRNTLLNLNRPQRKRARQMCEEGLLDASGHRLMLEEGQIRREFRIATGTLATLSQERLLRRERRLESAFYEISHDRMADSILQSKRFRLPKKWRKRLWTACIVAPLIVVGLSFWAVSVTLERERADSQRRKAEELLGFLLGEKFLGTLRETGRSEMLEQVQKQVEIRESAGDQSPALLRGLALRNKGELKRIQGSLSHSEALFTKALDNFEESLSNDVSRRETARTNYFLGEALADQGLVTQALSHYEVAVEAWRQVVTGASTIATEDCTSLADSLITAGTLRARMGDASKALTELERGVRIISSILFPQPIDDRCGAAADKAEPYPDAKALDVLSQAALYRAGILSRWRDEDYEGIWALAIQANKLNPYSISTKRNAVVALAYLGGARLSNDPQRALNDYSDVLAQLSELLHWDPNNRLWRREQAVTQMLISRGILKCRESEANASKQASKIKVCKPMPSVNEAEAMTLEAMATLRILAQHDPSDKSLQKDLAWALLNHARALAAAGRQKERLAALEEAERIFSTSSPDKADAEAVLDLGNFLIEKADALAALGSRRDADATLEEYIDRLKTIADHYDNLAYLNALRLAMYSKAELLRKAGDTTGATAADREKTRLDEHLDTILKDNSKRADQLGAQRTKQVNEGAELYNKKDYNAALRQFYAAESVAREYILVQLTAFEGYNELSNIYFWIDETLQNRKTDEERYVWLIRWMHAAQVAAWLAPEKSRLKTNENLDRARVRLSVFLYRHGRLNESLALAQEAIIVDEALVREAPQGSPERAHYLSRLAIAKTGIGKNRRESGMIGWEEPIRSALIHLQEAAEVDTKNPDYPQLVGNWRKYLAEELNAEERKGQALEEEGLAKRAYKEAAQRAPGNKEVEKAIRDLDEHGIR